MGRYRMIHLYGGDLKVGDIIELDLKYSTMVYLTNSANIEKVYR